ncbi:hypothetical protein [Endozoicomonas sp. ALD040]|uniref:hypothetical protein n=1 Tax=Endozoicomonas sp. ALD040 TaxID=3403079 RepID=UPI003BB0509B
MARTRKKINLSRLSREEKKKTWQRIKQVNPNMAALLQDAQFQSLRDHFQGEILIDVSSVNDSLNDSLNEEPEAPIHG